MKGKENPVENYMKQVDDLVSLGRVKYIRMTPIMNEGKCVGTHVEYEMDGLLITKDLPHE